MVKPAEIRMDTPRIDFVKLTHLPSGIAVTKHNIVQSKAKSEAIRELTILVELWKESQNYEKARERNVKYKQNE